MKYYETQFEDYIQSLQHYNLHPELEQFNRKLPTHVSDMANLILYGPTGCGKYTQMLRIINAYSPSKLKYSKKMRIQTEKHAYTYRISDIHYEIDMAILGCNSKSLWHELFFQIVDIVSMRPDKRGIIVCKNFHGIHTELLDVFYSYMQQTKVNVNIHIKFILLTEHVGFIPNNILNFCMVVPISRPSREQYERMIENNCDVPNVPNVHTQFTKKLEFTRTHSSSKQSKSVSILRELEMDSIMNAKELHAFSLIKSPEEIPSDIFNLICDNLILEMEKYELGKIEFTEFRYQLYDILVYNLDVSECLWYILYYFVQNGKLSTNMSEILERTFVFLKYFNNNYRPIYHLESMFFYLLLQIHNTTN